jgi:hypothetical protein
VGALDLITSIEARDVNSAWRPGVIAGILQMLIGLWASQQLFSSDRRLGDFRDRQPVKWAVSR